MRDLGYAEWYSRFVRLQPVNDSGEARFGCIVHEDTSPSASLNINTGLWKCFVPSCGAAGDCIDFYKHYHHLESTGETIQKLALDLKIIHLIDDLLIDQLTQNLNDKEQGLQLACYTFGVSPETLTRHRIGLDLRNGEVRFTIPVKGPSGLWEDIRRYNSAYKAKCKSWAEGHGGARFFPRENALPGKRVILFEGEKDTLRALDLGIDEAVTSTGGAGALPEDYRTRLKDSLVYVCYDIDAAGKTGARKAANKLATCAANVFLVHLPPEGLPEKGDFSDWVNQGGTLDQFETLLANSEEIDIQATRQRWNDNPTRESTREAPPEEPDVPTVRFLELNDPTLFGKPVRFLAHCIGSSVGMTEFQAPLEVGVICSQDQKYCKRCTFGQQKDDVFVYLQEDAPWPRQIDLKHEGSLQLYRCSQQAHNAAMKRFLGIPDRCYAVSVAELTRQPVQQLLLSQPVELSVMREPDESRRLAFYHAARIQDNLDYWFYGYIQADPKTRETIINIYRAEPAKSVIEDFTVDERVRGALQYFTPHPEHTIQAHFDRLHRVIEDDIGIYGRYELQQAVLETIFSPLEFEFGDKPIDTGWIEQLLIGDTRTGKSKAVQGMMRMINVGEFISCENTSAAGLIGGIQYIEKVGVPYWGAWPRNNGGFLVLDEIDELSKKRKDDIIEQLSYIRSQGVAEIQKIVTARTQARVRSIWITNPVGGREIASFSGAVRAIDGVFSSRQDIARFTKAVAVSTEDIPIERITADRARIQDEAVRAHFNALAMLVWSLQRHQVHFTLTAQAFLRNEAKRLTEKYHAGTPLIEKGSCLDKLAKLTCPIAALCASFREENEELILICDLEHAIYAVWHLEQTYDHPNMAYDKLSIMEQARMTIPDVDEVRATLTRECYPACDTNTIVSWMLSQAYLTRYEFSELIGDAMTAHRLWATLMRNHCIYKEGRRDSYTKSPAFVTLLNQFHADRELWARNKVETREAIYE